MVPVKAGALHVPVLAVNLQTLLDLLQALGEFLPVVHDDLAFALLREDLGHLLHLLLTLLDAIDTNVTDARDARSHRGCSTTLAVLDSDTFSVLHSQLLAREVVDLRVGLAGRGVQAGSSTVDMLVGEVFVNTSLLERGNNTGLGRGANDGQRVALLLEGFQLLGSSRAGSALLAQLGGDRTELTVNVGINILGRHGELVLVLKAYKHATEVEANEILEQLLNSIALGIIFLVFVEDLVSQVGAGLEGQAFRQAEGVVAVKKDVADLNTASCKYLDADRCFVN